MEIAIAIFLGIWFSLAGILATCFVFHDYKKDDEKSNNNYKESGLK